MDLDGVIFNSHFMLIKVYNEKYNKNITIKDINKWNYFDKNIFKKIYSEVCKRINEYLLIDLFTPYYMFLFNNRHSVDILTHQGNSKRKLEKCLYRLEIRKGFEYNRLIKAKDEKVRYDFDVFVDDNPTMINGIFNYPQKYLLLYDSPWNHSYDCTLYKNVFRVYNFSEVSEKIEQLEKIINHRNN